MRDVKQAYEGAMLAVLIGLSLLFGLLNVPWWVEGLGGGR